MKTNLLILTGGLFLLLPFVATGQRRQSPSLSPNLLLNDIEQAAIESFSLSSSQRDSLNEIIASFQQYGDGDPNKLIYIIATAWHESRMRPVRECFASSDSSARDCVASRRYGEVDSETGEVYYGRGFVQLTWRSNYQKMSDIFGTDFVQNPDQVLTPAIAADILVYGMMNGSFTRRALGTYINDSTIDFVNARRTVNGTDRASLIAGYANDLISQLPSGIAGSSYKIPRRVKRIAKEIGVEVTPSTRKSKKIDVWQNGKIIARIGHPDYPDYPTYLQLERAGEVEKGTAEARRQAFLNRFASCNTNNCTYGKILLWT